MVKHGLFCVFDATSGVYGMPFVGATAEAAKRDVIAAAKDPQTKLGLFPADFTLFEVGVFDCVEGYITGFPPISHGNVLQIVTQFNNAQGPILADMLDKAQGASISDIRNAFKMERGN